jgi:hypothetical protein
MYDNYYRRRLLLHPSLAHIRNALSAAQTEMDEQYARFLCEIDELKTEIAELREILALVTSITRENAEKDVV